jgi:hypothetical protein
MTIRYWIGRRSNARGTEFAAESPLTFQGGINALRAYIESNEPESTERTDALHTIFEIGQTFARVTMTPPSRFDVTIRKSDYFLKLTPDCTEGV